MSPLISRLARVLPAVAYMLAIFYLGSLPPGRELTPSMNDKLLHAIGFAALVPLNLLAAGALLAAWPHRARLGAAAAVAVVVGGLLEVHQLLFTRRSAELADWVADIVGIVASAALIAAYRASRPPPEEASVAPTGER